MRIVVGLGDSPAPRRDARAQRIRVCVRDGRGKRKRLHLFRYLLLGRHFECRFASVLFLNDQTPVPANCAAAVAVSLLLLCPRPQALYLRPNPTACPTNGSSDQNRAAVTSPVTIFSSLWRASFSVVATIGGMRRAGRYRLTSLLGPWKCTACRKAATVAQSDARRLLDSLKQATTDERRWTVRKVDVVNNGGLGLLKAHGFSLQRLLASTHSCEELASAIVTERLPAATWNSAAARQAFMDSLEQECGVRCLADWATVQRGAMEAYVGPGLFRKHSKAQLLRERFPDASEEELLAAAGVRYSWRERASRRAFLENVAKELDITTAQDWKKVKSADVVRRGGSRLLSLYGGSLSAALQDAFPDTLGSLSEESFRATRRQGHWKEEENQRVVFRRILTEEGLEEGPRGWRKLTTAAVMKGGGATVLAMHNGSLSSALARLFPESQEGENGESARRPMPRGHFDSLENQRLFLEEVAAMHGFEAGNLKEWARVTRSSILHHPWGSSFLRRHASIYEALAKLFPEHGEEWNVFDHRPVAHRSFWASKENVAAFLARVQESLQITCDDDWARVSVAQLRELGGSGLLNRMPLAEALPLAFPAKQWGHVQPVRHKRAMQRHLRLSLKALFEDVAPIQQACVYGRAALSCSSACTFDSSALQGV